MNTLAHKIILYDDVCPLCKAYTNGFVQLGWLLPNHRIGFSEATETILKQIDIDRARHEIPLYDTQTGETLYGKEALFFIIGEKLPLLKPLFKFNLFRIFIHGLYQLITYNRRIIAGSKPPKNGFDCAPDFNAFYRWLYIGLAAMTSFIMDFNFVKHLDNQAIVFLGVLTMGILKGLLLNDFETKTTYFGHLATIFLIISLLANIIGFTIFTVPILMILGIYLFQKRTT
jgi:predicted DCC family thiol-disulfide oxidoreductase YuxK